MKNFGLIGYPLTHSFSKQFFENKFAKENIDASYENYELECIDHFPELFNQVSFNGLNVTIPYKESVIPFLDELDEISKSVRSCEYYSSLFKGWKCNFEGVQYRCLWI